jgi:antitoxin component YwqK of YwqJK toxin-antitoxin module
MYNFRLFLIVFSLAFLLYSCREAKKEFYSNGKLKSVVHVKGGKYYGKALFYYHTGDIQLECFYKDDLLQGPLIRYYTLNRKKEAQNYDKGELDGLSTMWYEDGGKLSETNYMGGVLNGPYREYHPNNRLKVQGQYQQGFFSGKWLYFNVGGDIVGDGKFIHGTGKQRSYYPDGMVRHEVHFKDNLKEGEDTEYDETGKITSLKIYSRDSLVRIIR